MVTDSLADPRSDRVMPIVDEEQVLFCRLMRQRIPRGALVLDVGVGSGVLGIYAAKHCGARVVGIDISERAVTFSRYNAGVNGVPVANDVESLRPGELFLQQADFLSGGSDLANPDVVLLNPPFSPTAPGYSLAVHASAGEDGQEPFRDQVRVAASCLSSTGICLGYQMTYEVARPLPPSGELRAAFGPTATIAIGHVLDDVPQIPARAFLSAVYADRLAIPDGIFDDYLARVGTPEANFSLIYYEVVRGAAQPTTTQFDIGARPPRNWSDRIWLHKLIAAGGRAEAE